MSDLTIFAFESAAVRTVMRGNEPWFVASDISKALGYREAEKMTRMLDEDEKGTHKVGTLGGEQTVSIINESGLYAAILKSRRPEAKKFRKWVTSEVLPSIRKNGAYIHCETEAVVETRIEQSSQRTIYPMHEADKVVQSDRVFRAALRSARASGIREVEAFAFARKVAVNVTGMDLAGAIMKEAEAMAPKPAEEGLEKFMAAWVSGETESPYGMDGDAWALYYVYAAACERDNYRAVSESTFFDRRWLALWPLRKKDIEERKQLKAKE